MRLRVAVMPLALGRRIRRMGMRLCSCTPFVSGAARGCGGSRCLWPAVGRSLLAALSPAPAWPVAEAAAGRAEWPGGGWGKEGRRGGGMNADSTPARPIRPICQG